MSRCSSQNVTAEGSRASFFFAFSARKFRQLMGKTSYIFEPVAAGFSPQDPPVSRAEKTAACLPFGGKSNPMDRPPGFRNLGSKRGLYFTRLSFDFHPWEGRPPPRPGLGPSELRAIPGPQKQTGLCQIDPLHDRFPKLPSSR